MKACVSERPKSF